MPGWGSKEEALKDFGLFDDEEGGWDDLDNDASLATSDKFLPSLGSADFRPLDMSKLVIVDDTHQGSMDIRNKKEAKTFGDKAGVSNFPSHPQTGRGRGAFIRPLEPQDYDGYARFSSFRVDKHNINSNAVSDSQLLSHFTRKAPKKTSGASYFEDPVPDQFDDSAYFEKVEDFGKMLVKLPPRKSFAEEFPPLRK